MSLPNNLSSKIKFSNIEDFKNFDIRASAIDCLFINIVGVNENTVEWCPNSEPPIRQEYLAWLWLIKPKLGDQILTEASAELSKLIKAYESQAIDSWFSYMAE